ncbi:MAG TPA: amidase family protein [Steroidobacter sp.]|uniref:amidase n=1 Tax=Steroidobacter sp. TaxID=1978227 RepID=UPI002EDA3CC4
MNANETRLTSGDIWQIGRLDAHDQAALVRSGQLTAIELVEAAILRIEQLDPVLNAITHRSFDSARERTSRMNAAGPLAGVPYLLKDGLDYRGMPSRCGSRSRAHSGNIGVDYEYTRRLDAAGLIPLGKTNVPEFGLLPTTESVLYGPARNPWSLQHSPGGSSGGAAVAVASGMVPVAHAADGGGSIRIPASCCGIFGLKPGRGRNVRARAHHVIEDLLVGDTLLSRTVRDAHWALGVTAPHAADLGGAHRKTSRRLRIALVMNNLLGDAPHSEVMTAISRTAELCAKLGHAVEETTLPLDGPAVANSFRTLWGYLAAGIVERAAAESQGRPMHELLEPWTLSMAQWSECLEPMDLEQALEQAVRASAGLGNLFTSYDVFLSPVLKTLPVEIGQLAPTRPFDALFHDMFEYVSYTPLQNLTGSPSMSVPLFFSIGGLPIGSMFTAARGGEATLLDLAYEIEAANSWAGRWPP